MPIPNITYVTVGLGPYEHKPRRIFAAVEVFKKVSLREKGFENFLVTPVTAEDHLINIPLAVSPSNVFNGIYSANGNCSANENIPCYFGVDLNPDFRTSQVFLLWEDYKCVGTTVLTVTPKKFLQNYKKPLPEQTEFVFEVAEMKILPNYDSSRLKVAIFNDVLKPMIADFKNCGNQGQIFFEDSCDVESRTQQAALAVLS